MTAASGEVDRLRALARAGRREEAAARLAILLAAHPHELPALLLDADLRLARGDLAGGESAARRASTLAPSDAEPHVALGRALLQGGAADHAADAFRAALALQPRHPVAAMLLNGLLQAEERFVEAEATTAGLAVEPGASAQLLTNHAGALMALGRAHEGLDCARRAVAADPRDSLAVRTLAAALIALGRDAEAERELRAAQASGMDGPRLRVALGRAVLGQDRLDDAEAILRSVVDRAPAYVDAQRALAHLVWSRTGDLAAVLRPLDVALGADSADEELHMLRAELRYYAGDLAGACAALAAVADRAGPALRLAASNMALRIDPEAAGRHAEAVARLAPDKPGVLTALAEARLAQGRAAEAAVAAERLIALDPNDQHALALLGSAWRLAGDPRETALDDYDALVRSYTLEPPDGWPTLDAFLADVAIALERLHVTSAHPIGQSVRGGTQTTRSLLQSEDPAIRGLFRALDAPIRRYVAEIGPGDDPMRRRRGVGHRFVGAWSVRLRGGGGRHTNHMHPEGWISSACYIALPRAAAGEGRQGWLTFGEPGTPTSPPLLPQLYVRPELGKLVLFPSYVWHGTTPFEGDDVRLTVAFDLVPGDAAPI